MFLIHFFKPTQCTYEQVCERAGNREMIVFENEHINIIILKKNSAIALINHV